jgi:predicted phosphodiesterase
VAFRTYPEQNPRDNKIVGMKIGEKRFAFLHGHQFDTFQIFYRISRMIKFRFDPIDWCQDIANVYINKYIKFSLNRPTIVFCIILAIYVISYILYRATPIGSWLGILLVLFSFLITVTMVPKLIINAAIPVYESLLKAKHESADQVIKARYNSKKGKKIEADIIVFGHTHVPDMYYMKEIERLFINTGCWVNEHKIKKEEQNTFVYIDSLDQYLLKWSKEKITCLSKGSEVISGK